MAMHLVENHRVIGGIAHHGHRVVVLGGRAQHGRATDIDMLDGVGKGHIGRGNGLLKLVQVNRHEVDHLDIVLAGLSHVLLGVTTAQQGAVHLGVQRLHATIHHLGVAGKLLNRGNGNARSLNRLGGSARRDNLNAKIVNQCSCEIDDAGLIGDRDKRAPDLHISGHAFLLVAKGALIPQKLRYRPPLPHTSLM